MVNTQPAGDMDIIQMLREDYQLKASYLTAHFSRLWTRFSFLLSIQLALFGAVGYLLYDKPLARNRHGIHDTHGRRAESALRSGEAVNDAAAARE